jgi:hypothetical protein
LDSTGAFSFICADRWVASKYGAALRELVSVPKLLIPDIAGSNEVVFEQGHYHPHHNLYFVVSDVWDIEVLGGLLSSRMALFFVWSYAVKMRGGYWMVENGPHWTLDVPLNEDAHPWIESEPQGALVLTLLRRIAYEMLSLFRAVTLRADNNHATPWKSLLERFKVALYAAMDSDLTALRARTGWADVGPISACRPPRGLQSRRLRKLGDGSGTMERTGGAATRLDGRMLRR